MERISRRFWPSLALALLALVSLWPTATARADDELDVVVYGGSSGGIAAAIQTARLGKRVVLIEPSTWLGGLTTGGLGATDIGNKQAIGGIAREFYARIWDYYDDPSRWTRETRDEYLARRADRQKSGEPTMWTFEPHAADEVFADMLREAAVTVVRNERLNRRDGVHKTGSRIDGVTMESGRTFRGRMYIDATYEGDLMAAAGVDYHVGREPAARYDESLNGVQVGRAVKHQFIKQIDPYVIPGDASSGLLEGIDATGPGEEFAGDHRVQTYNFRLCTTDVPENRLPWKKPEGYDPAKYELLLRNFDAGDARIPWAPVWMPNRKTDTNNNFAVSTDYIGQNYDYPDGDYATREQIWRDHRLYTEGLLWTLANSPRVPDSVRAHFQRLGLARDEFKDNDNWPRQLYIREARRMVSDYVMTEANCRRQRVADDSVGMGAYNMDSHNVQRYVTPEGFVRNEGDIQYGVKPYPISYRSIIPRADQCTNLLVPVCLSASHIAYGSIRMEPVFMVLGQSAATAAVQAIDADQTVQDIDYQRLKHQLLADKQVLDFQAK